jgi:hypothetical protein
MRQIESTTEHEMVALFLRTEIQSERFRDEILALLARDGKDTDIVLKPDCADAEENAYRIQLLGDFRGYRQQRELFETFPDVVEWYRVTISKEELARVRYIDYSYWNELSAGSRLPEDAAKTIRAGIEVFGVPNDGVLRTAQAVRDGVRFPELILIGTSPDSLIVLEGHVRLTAYLLAWDYAPDELPVLMGISPDFVSWD